MSERPRTAPGRSLERHRAAWFVVAVIVILAAVVAFEILDDAGPAPDTRATGPGDAATVPVTLRDALPTPTPTAAKPSDDVAASKRAARRFLAHYLPFTYGQEDARYIPLISEQLRAEIIRDQPRVPPAVRKLTPQIDVLQMTAISGPRAKIVALVIDGMRYYSVPLELTKTADGWIISDVWSF